MDFGKLLICEPYPALVTPRPVRYNPHMNKWLRRLLYLVIITIWLAMMLFPVSAFRLSRRGQIQVGPTRIFLVDEGRQEGVGFSTVRNIRGDVPCRRTTIHYVMWSGVADNAQSCTCDAAGEYALQGRRCVLSEE